MHDEMKKRNKVSQSKIPFNWQICLGRCRRQIEFKQDWPGRMGTAHPQLLIGECTLANGEQNIVALINLRVCNGLTKIV